MNNYNSDTKLAMGGGGAVHITNATRDQSWQNTTPDHAGSTLNSKTLNFKPAKHNGNII